MRKWFLIYNYNNKFISEFYGTEKQLKNLMKEIYKYCYYKQA